MARYWFGGGVADWTFGTVDGIDGSVNDVAQVLGGVTVTFWNQETGGTQLTDLLAADETTPITSVTSSDGSDGRAQGTIPRFQGPDGVTLLWASAGGGPRQLLHADLGDVVKATATQAQQTKDDFASYAESPPLGFNPDWSMDTVAAAGNTYRRTNLTGRAVTLRTVHASLGGNTASGGPIVFTVYIDGVEVFTAANRPSIAAGARVSTGGTTFAVSAIPAGSYMTAEVISAPASTSGSKLVIEALAY